MISTMFDLRQAVREPRARQELVLAVALILQPVMRTLLARDMGRDLLIALQGMHMPALPDCVSDPALWAGIVEGYGRRYDGARLTRGCGCLVCSNMAGPLDSQLETRLCDGCRRSRYCSTECQRQDWVAGGHRGVCGKGWWKRI